MLKLILLVLFTIHVYGCKNKAKTKEPEVKLVSIQQEENEVPVPPPPPSALNASAYLIYNDGTVSDFDVLNDKSKALWNVIIGAGDAEKPSEKVKLVFQGAYDSINIKVKNGKRLALNKKNLSFNGKLEFVIQNTGCDEVFVTVTKYKTIILKDTIPFHCGE
jgi:hypothetical protein